MSEEGYTLAEMLTALTILGLALGGLGLVTSLISRQQGAASRLHARLVQDRAADKALGQWMARVDSNGLRGEARRLSAPCEGGLCQAWLDQRGRRPILVLDDGAGPARRLDLSHRDLRFAFVHAEGSASAWPLADAERHDATLRAVRLAAAEAAAPVALARAWTLEPRDCHFDAIVGACRTSAP